MRAIQDFPEVDAGSSGNLLTFDVGDYLENTGLSLVGTPTISAIDQSGTDPDAQTHVLTPVIGTPIGPIGSGVVNGAMQCIFSGGVGGVTYLMYARCLTDRAGVYAEVWAHLPCVTPI